LRDETGKIINTLSSGEDITEHKKSDNFISIHRDLEISLSRSNDLEDVLAIVIDTATKLDGMDYGDIYLDNATTGALDLVSSKELSPGLIKKVSHYKKESENVRLVIKGKPVYIEYDKLGVPKSNAESKEGLLSVAIIPITYNNRMIACMDIASHTIKNIPTNTRNSLETLALLAGSVIARILAEEQSKASLKEKDVLLQEIHHRVKNNMQVISSLMGLQKDHIKDKDSIEMLAEIQNCIKSMALIHEKLYKSEDLAKINFIKYIEDLSLSLFQFYEVDSTRISLKVDGKDVFFGNDTSIPCGLIINELVSNSLKHSFPNDRKGNIQITLHPINNEDFQLVISDNGIGVPEGLDIINTKSLGLKLVDVLVRQINGNIKCNRTRGTEFIIKFKQR
jgi:two-component sensor histidine kinase